MTQYGVVHLVKTLITAAKLEKTKNAMLSNAWPTYPQRNLQGMGLRDCL